MICSEKIRKEEQRHVDPVQLDGRTLRHAGRRGARSRACGSAGQPGSRHGLAREPGMGAGAWLASARRAVRPDGGRPCSGRAADPAAEVPGRVPCRPIRIRPSSTSRFCRVCSTSEWATRSTKQTGMRCLRGASSLCQWAPTTSPGRTRRPWSSFIAMALGASPMPTRRRIRGRTEVRGRRSPPPSAPILPAQVFATATPASAAGMRTRRSVSR